jgi:hypothetical protein
MGTGITNWLFAIPAIYTIDRYGRRSLLLFGFPVMLIFLLWTGFSFFLDQDVPNSPRRVGMIAFGIYAFMAAYSPSEVSFRSFISLDIKEPRVGWEFSGSSTSVGLGGCEATANTWGDVRTKRSGTLSACPPFPTNRLISVISIPILMLPSPSWHH